VTHRISLREAYGNILVELGRERDDFITLDADMCGATFVDIFRKTFPQRHLRFGIAEQAMMCAAGGLSTTGYIPIVNTMAVFATMRAIEQLRTSIAMPKFNVKIVGSHQGLDVGEDGPTHQCIEDVAITRAIPNLIILSPVDRIELEAMMRFMLDFHGPVYLRTGRSPVPDVNKRPYDFNLGCWSVLEHGKDVSIIACGVMVEKAILSSRRLKEEGISAQVVNASFLKPVDERDLMEKVGHTGCVVTAEDHTILGGIGSIVSDILCKNQPLPVEKIGLRDCFGESGTPEQLFAKYSMDVEDICQAVKKVMGRKNASAPG